MRFKLGKGTVKYGIPLFLLVFSISLFYVFGSYQEVKAADTGAKSPGTMADDAAVGEVAWDNPNNANASDNAYAVVHLVDQLSHYLKATNFGFSIPADVITIDGIKVEVEEKTAAGGINVRANLVNENGTVVGVNHTNSVAIEKYYTYGNATDLWGETWTYSDINDIDFGVVLHIYLRPGDATISVDHIRITVYYTAGDTTPPVIGTISANSTIAGSYANFTANVTDETGLSGVITGSNSTGAFQNGTWYSLTNNSLAWNGTTLPASGVVNVTFYANDSSNNWANRTQLFTVTSADTCTYSGSGDWNVNCADNCVTSAAVNVAGNVLITGTGRFKATADILYTGVVTVKGTDAANVCVVELVGGAFKR